ncbi:MAG: hypothetical protein GWP10_19720 [Nitrospiraceae bacterium]|nr:hypothetical protein [Nitrospiraceae bacterium]
MRKETKDVVYIVLDMLDSIAKTSKDDYHFIQINENMLKETKNELFGLLTQTQKEEMSDKKTELIGILPSILIDKNKFSNNEDIVKLAENSLNLVIPSWRKKSRNEIIGILMAKIATKEERELELFFSAWREFIKDKSRKKEEKKNFVDVWLEFFDHYRGQK